MGKNGPLGVIMDINHIIEALGEDIKDMIAKGFLIIVAAIVVIILLGAVYFTNGLLGIGVVIAFVFFSLMAGWSLNRVARK